MRLPGPARTRGTTERGRGAGSDGRFGLPAHAAAPVWTPGKRRRRFSSAALFAPAQQVDGTGWPRENPAKDWRELGQGKGRVGGVERALIPAFAELDAGLVIGAGPVALAPVRVLVRVSAAMEELKYPVVADDPVHLFAHIGSDEGRAQF